MVLPAALYDLTGLRQLEHLAITTFGIPGIDLMERAGRASYAGLRQAWPSASRVVVVCGAGNNGGDGYVVARLAQAAGLQVTVVQVGAPATTGDAAITHRRIIEAGVRITDDTGALAEAEVCVDALFGIGLNKPLGGEAARAVAAMNAVKCPVLSLDIPSGIVADTGAVAGCAVHATATMTFIGLKQGLFTGAAPDYVGKLWFDDLAVPRDVYAAVPATAERCCWADIDQRLPPRARTAHKGHAGHVLIVGGAPGTSGAVRLAAEAALRTGAGLVSVAVHPAVAATLNGGRPEIMVHAVDDPADLTPLLRRANVVAVGPGLGQSPWAIRLFSEIRAYQGPLVVDADGLNLLASDVERRENWVLTPHPGEAARLLGCGTTGEIAQDRFAAARALQAKYGGTLVLKGAGTIVQSAGRPRVITDGNPGMASGGMGDVLTGVIASLTAQGMPLPTAAVAGAALHAAAADRAAVDGERGLLASDLMPTLRALVN